ncbi:hypothetical protein D3C72_744430 [compost metagenome]
MWPTASEICSLLRACSRVAPFTWRVRPFMCWVASVICVEALRCSWVASAIWVMSLDTWPTDSTISRSAVPAD